MKSVNAYRESNFYYMVLKYNCDKIPAKSFFKGDEKI